jgi:hypothetical protein
MFMVTGGKDRNVCYAIVSADYKYSPVSVVESHPTICSTTSHNSREMSQELRKSVDSTGYGSVPTPSSASTRTPRTLIIHIANSMVTHLRTVPAIKVRPEVVLDLNKLYM